MTRRTTLALIIWLGGLAGCGRWKAEREAESAVRAYNEALIVAYRTNTPVGLEQVAGPKEVRRIVALIDLKRGAGLALESELERLEILGVEVTGEEAATVRTRERWRYWDRTLRPGMPVGQVFVADMWMTWTVGPDAGRRKVLEGKTERSEYLEPSGFHPGNSDREDGGAAEKTDGKEEST